MNLYPVIQILADGELHSGQELAAALGVSRTAVWKQLQLLESDYGLQMTAVRGQGYQLNYPLDLLDHDQMMKWLDPALQPGLTIQLEPVITSTNDTLMSMPPGKADFALCAAEMQTAGKGRRGRSWHSPFASNLYFSLAFDLHGGGAAVDGLSLVAGLATAEALETLVQKSVTLKWPNDVWMADRKLAGVLVELQGEAQGGFRVVLGIGLNVYLTPEQGSVIDQPWTSLQQHQAVPAGGRNRLLAVLLNHLLPCLNEFRKSGFAPFYQRWQGLDALRDQPLMVPGQDLRGTGAGVDERGCLLLKTTDGLITLNAGEVSIRREQP
ncbi:MAG: bifunctional biotin--[acetyl-CoA-carboxylase] ligase/biotin operon repressor BirA [Halomonadaceae bacterium]|nr:MAG: bifunctional biotin--[acetyl-CoA-carboxylase] ligase/biotin operon repressor BirA [Halomonadaceae bacterium]